MTHREGKTKRIIYGISGVIGLLLLVILGGMVYLQATTTVVENREEYERYVEQERPITPREFDDYSVAADQPRILTIDKLNLKARIMPMGVNADNSMQAPANINDAGWYTGSAKPGQPGAMMIDAHASGRTREGLFAYLDTLQLGDKIRIERGDSEKFVYTVHKVDVVPLSQVDMKQFGTVVDGKSEGVNLITCTGQWVQSGRTYDHRVMVYAVRD